MDLNMGIIKLEVNLGEATQAIEHFKQNRLKAFELIAQEVLAVLELEFQ